MRGGAQDPPPPRASARAAAGWWLYKNASIERLRAEFVPWMERLERWRDANEAMRRALRSREATAADPEGVAALRAWAWEGLERLALRGLSRREADARDRREREKTTGRVVFTVGGFRADGARVERAASAIVTERDRRGRLARHSALASSSPLWNRIETHAALPRRHRRGRPRRAAARSAAQEGQPPDRRHLARLRRRRPRLRPRRLRGSLRRRRRALDPLPQRRPRPLHGRHREGRPREVRRTKASPRPASPRATSTATAFPTSSSRTPSAPRASSATAATARSRRRPPPPASPCPATCARPRSPTSTATATSISSSCVTGDYYSQMPDPALRRERRPPELPLPERRPRPLHRRHEGLGPRKARRAGRSRRSSGLRPATAAPTSSSTNDFGLKNLYRNEGGKRFEDVTKKTGTQARAYGMSARVGGLRRRRPARPLHDRHRHAVVLPPRVPVDARRPRRPALPPDRDPVDGEDGDGQLAPPPDARPHVRGRDGALGRGARRLELELRRRRPRRRRLARHLRDQRHVGRRPRPRRELEFWWETLAYWDDYVAGTKTFDRQGRGHRRHRARPLLPQPRRGRGRGQPPLFEERAFLEGLDLETNGRAVVAFDANGDGALDLYVRSVAGARGALPRQPEARTSTSCASASRARPARTTATASARASRRRCPDGRRIVTRERATPAAISRPEARSCTSASAARRASKASPSAGPPASVQDLGRDRRRRPHDRRGRGARCPGSSTLEPRKLRTPWNHASRTAPRAYDVVIVGGAVAGASTAILLKRGKPELRILVVEKTGPLRLEGRRVDRRGLGLLPDARPQAVRPPLARAAPQAGLPLLVLQRRRHVPARGVGDRARRSSPARRRSSSTAPKLDEHLLKVAARGRQRGLASREGHGVRARRRRGRQHADRREERRRRASTVSCRWLVDATGRQAMLARKRGGVTPIESHPTSAIWVRYRGVKDMDGVDVAGTDSGDPWHARRARVAPPRDEPLHRLGLLDLVHPAAGRRDERRPRLGQASRHARGHDAAREAHALPGREPAHAASCSRAPTPIEGDCRSYAHLPYFVDKFIGPGWTLRRRRRRIPRSRSTRRASTRWPSPSGRARG